MSQTNLTEASSQWANRPDDERFGSIDDLFAAVSAHKESSQEFTSVDAKTITVEPIGKMGLGIRRTGSDNVAHFSNWSFSQAARRVGAPAEYLASLPADRAADLLNFGISRLGDDSGVNVLLRQNGHLNVSSFTSHQYSRIWNADLVERIRPMTERGWRVPPARPARTGQAGTRRATAADVTDLSDFSLRIKEGDWIAPAGLYASDRDMFIFMVNPERQIETGGAGGASRGFFLDNSEVGAGALKVTAFYYDHVCGNHIVWGASQVTEIKIIHRGEVDMRKLGQLDKMMGGFLDEPASVIEARIRAAKATEIARPDEIVATVFERVRGRLAKSVIASGFEIAQNTAHEHECSPTSPWGLFSGITRHSQATPFAGDREAIDRHASKILDIKW